MVNLPTTRMAAQMNRHRHHLAPSDLTGDQLESIKDSDQIRRLREVVV